ncbi:MAG: L,D-transpeptidase family protein [Thermodesulfovibrionales bacterium]|nr:L,D-transpeptidase family protein [Thermodesulfovibrionales bacterium]
MKYYEVKEGESLIEIARIFNLGYNEIADANPGTDPFVPMPGNRVKIPTIWILPERKPSTGIVINLSEMRLYYFFKKEGRSFVKTYPVGIGDEGSETPAGFFRITHKIENPSWRVPESIRKEKPWLPPVVPPGPDNPLGSHALRLSSGSILIHGTDRPWGIGRQVSHGCIRLYPEDIVKLFYEVKIGTQVFIVREPIKIGIKEKEIYIEIHKDPISGDMNYYDEAIRMLVKKNLISYIELDRLYEVIKRKDGIPVKIGRLTEEQSPPKNKSYERAIVH